MTETAYPLTGKPWRWETLVSDAEDEDRAAAQRGQALPPDVRYAVQDICHKARAYVEDVRPYADAEIAATERQIGVINDALAWLVSVRVNVREAARMVGYDRNHILRLIQAGTLYAERDGRDWRIPVYALEGLPPRSPAGRPRKAQADASSTGVSQATEGGESNR